MLKFITLGAVAAIFSTSMTSTLALPEKDTEHKVKAITSNLVSTSAIDAYTELTSAETLIALADSRNNPDVVEVDPTAIMLVAAVGGIGIGVALNASKAKIFSAHSTTDRGSISVTEDAIRIEQASRNLRKELLRLLHDDRNTANRLLSQVRKNNPNRSVNWCVEKVIYDLERDRRS